jgi:hypothetical protein
VDVARDETVELQAPPVIDSSEAFGGVTRPLNDPCSLDVYREQMRDCLVVAGAPEVRHSSSPDQ